MMKLFKFCGAFFALICLTLTTVSSAEVVTVNSLEELMPYLKKDNVEVKMAPGTYTFTAKDASSRKFRNPAEVVEGKLSYAMILVEANNSVYDFTDVTIEVETAVFNAYEGCEFNELHIIGSNNVVKNLKLVDVGGLTDFPKYGCVNVLVDGASNLVEGVEVRSVGSYPYGYGELFGKGGPATIRHKKHSVCLVRGYKTHIKNCRLYSRTYGHCLFMQAADMPLIEGCHIESEMTTTDKVLSEEGSGSAADKIDFKTVWGYRVPKGHTIALCEEGIRAYNGGSTIVDGVRYKRGTSNVTVKDCFVKDTRGGVTLTHASGFKYVENTTAIGCNRGFAVGHKGKIVNCYADTQNGPALGVDYERDADIVADITLLPYEGMGQNGTTHAAIIIGTGHQITFKKGEGLVAEKELMIQVGGDNKTIGSLEGDNNYMASGITIINETDYPILLDDNSSNITGSTKGEVIDQGTNNSIKGK